MPTAGPHGPSAPTNGCSTPPRPTRPASPPPSPAIRAEAPHSLVDISDREIAIAVEGARAEELLTAGCPIDLRRLASGDAKRTIFDTAQIVLLRDAPDRFRIEVWRSFAPHVEDLLHTVNAELASGF